METNVLDLTSHSNYQPDGEQLCIAEEERRFRVVEGGGLSRKRRDGTPSPRPVTGVNRAS